MKGMDVQDLDEQSSQGLDKRNQRGDFEPVEQGNVLIVKII